MPFIETDGIRLFYEQRGPADGEPVLLVMGGGGSLLWWPPALVDALAAAGLRVLLYDNRDAGLSSYVRARYGLEEMAGDALGLLDGLGITSAHLVGVSLGGRICQAAALRAPERVRSLTLLTTTPGPDERLAPTVDGVFDGFDWDGDPVEVTVEFCRAVAGSRFTFDEPFYRALAIADVARGVNPDSGQERALSAPSHLDALAAVRAPTLVVHGTEDPIFPFDHAQALVTAISGARLVIWEGVGHELPPQLMPGLAEEILALL